MKGRTPGRGPNRGQPKGRSSAPSSSRGARPSSNSKGGQGKGSGRPSSRPPRERELRFDPKDRWVIGIHSVEEALRVRPKMAREFWVREDYMSSQALRELAELAQRHRIPLQTRTAGQLDQLGSGHQGVAVAMTQAPELDWDQLKEPGKKVVVALDGLEDPHNLGSIIRTSWLAGVDAILIPEDRAVGITPTVCKVASGGVEHIPVEAHANLPSVLQQLKDIGFWVYGLSEKGKNNPWKFELPEKVVWVVGSEGSGMRIPTERACDELVRLPQVSTGSSYNAAIAAAMALSETCRQFGKPE